MFRLVTKDYRVNLQSIFIIINKLSHICQLILAVLICAILMFAFILLLLKS